MKLAFGIPNLMQVKAITEPWETTVTGAEQVKLAKWADKLGYGHCQSNVAPAIFGC